MAKPVPSVTIPPSAGKKQAAKLSYAQLRALWIQAGGDPALASTMAAIALAESGGRVDALNDNPNTGDYSVGPWQINYFGDMRAGRTRAYGTPEKLRADPLANARAAVAIYGGQGLSAWTTYTSGAYTAFLRAQTPEEKAAQAAAVAQAKAQSQAYQDAATAAAIARIPGQTEVAAAKLPSQIELKAARQQAEAVSHVSDADSWITVNKNRRGFVTGFGQAYGPTPPDNVLTAGGRPLTKTDFGNLWGATYDRVFQEFTGRMPTPDEQADIIREGISVYTLKTRLANRPEFKRSPAWLQQAAGLKDRAKQVLGVDPPDSLIRTALAQGWDMQNFDAMVKKQPEYKQSPQYKTALSTAGEVFKQIYGAPDANDHKWIQHAVESNWTQDDIAAALRSDEAYKYSPEYEAKALAFLDAMGLVTGGQAVLKPTKPTFKDDGSVTPGLPLKLGMKKQPRPLNASLPLKPTVA